VARLLGNTRRRISITWLFAAAIVLGIFGGVAAVVVEIGHQVLR
jgi:hypothetical protein